MVTPAGVGRRLAIFTRRVCCHREQRQSACIIYKHRRDDSDRIQPAGQGKFSASGRLWLCRTGIAVVLPCRSPSVCLKPVAVEALPEKHPPAGTAEYTLARSMQLKMDWQEVSNSFTDEDGNTIQPPEEV